MYNWWVVKSHYYLLFLKKLNVQSEYEFPSWYLTQTRIIIYTKKIVS